MVLLPAAEQVAGAEVIVGALTLPVDATVLVSITGAQLLPSVIPKV
jgi:hypothetical protein